MGLAGGLGLLMRATCRNERIYRLIYFIFIMLPFSMSLPWSWLIKFPVWGLAGITAIFIYKLPNDSLPKTWHQKIIFSYCALMTMLIMVWSTINRQAHAWVWLGVPAALTCLICIARIRQAKEI